MKLGISLRCVMLVASLACPRMHGAYTIVSQLAQFVSLGGAIHLGTKVGNWYYLHTNTELKPVDPLVEEFIRSELTRHGNEAVGTMLIKMESCWSMNKPIKLLAVHPQDHDLLGKALAARQKGEKLSQDDEQIIKKCVMTVAHEHAHYLYNHTAKVQLGITGMMYGSFNFARHLEKRAQAEKLNGFLRIVSRDVRACSSIAALWYGFAIGMYALSRTFEKNADAYALNTAPSLDHVRAWRNHFKKEAELTARFYDEGHGRRVLRSIYQFSKTKQPFSSWLIEQKNLVGIADALALATHPSHHDRAEIAEKFKEKFAKK